VLEVGVFLRKNKLEEIRQRMRLTLAMRFWLMVTLLCRKGERRLGIKIKKWDRLKWCLGFVEEKMRESQYMLTADDNSHL
jgi:hypothetical protein